MWCFVKMVTILCIAGKVITSIALPESYDYAILYVTNPDFPIDIGRLDRVFLL